MRCCCLSTVDGVCLSVIYLPSLSRPAVVSEKTIPITPVSPSVRPFRHVGTSEWRDLVSKLRFVFFSLSPKLTKEKQTRKVITATTMAIVHFCRREGDVSSMECSDQMRRRTTTTRKMKHSMDSNRSIASVEWDSREDRVERWTTRKEEKNTSRYFHSLVWALLALIQHLTPQWMYWEVVASKNILRAERFSHRAPNDEDSSREEMSFFTANILN